MKKNQLQFDSNLVWWVELGASFTTRDLSQIGDKKNSSQLFVMAFKT